jgi:3-hydroxyacyl-CoA dehydrogenase/enoyl-CoA hydratase/3-hydroxybutyryl-CoA epimerase
MAFTYKKDDQNIVTLTMDMPGRSTNVINKEYSLSLLKNIKRLEQDSKLAGVIITSAKKTFLAGADIEMLYRQEDPQACFDLIEAGKATMRKLELLSIPIVAAVNGTALGGGIELALCCNYRIVLNNPRAKFGFPEVTLGILPGGGGVARLPRMIGIEPSLPLLIDGKQVNASKAVEKGLMDELVSTPEEMFDRARSWIIENQKCQQPWDMKGFKIPGGNAQDSRVAPILAIAPAMLQKKTMGNYPAPEAIISAVAEGSLVDYETASRIESRYFVTLATGKVSKNMMKAFWFQMNEINAGASRPSEIGPSTISKVGILGSGLMGHGIAYVTALAGMEVVMIDANQENANKGFARISVILEGTKKRGLITEDKVKQTLKKITPTSDYDMLEGCDLIVEAVFEDRKLKGKVTEKAEISMLKSGVFASNTSTIPITSLAKRSSRPEQFIGIHFFSPVHKMKLVEIIKGEKTSSETLAKAFDYVLKIRKIPIVVNDSRGFYTSRVFERYTCEGMALLAEGNDAQAIEAAGKQAGYPVGPLAVIDEINLGLAAHIRDQTWRDLEAEGKPLPKGPWDAVLDLMTKEIERTGRAGGGGFYEYPKTGKKYLWPDLEKYFPVSKSPVSQQEMIDRFYFSQAVETIRCYEENVLTSVADANIGSIFGWGFAAFKGGTLQFVNDFGVTAFRDRAKELEEKYGERFSPPELLIKMAETRETFE